MTPGDAPWPVTPTHAPGATRRLRVRSMTRLTPRVMGVVLESLHREPLPQPHPGDHIDLRLGAGLARSYSLVGQAGAPDRYEIAVALDANSRGGSRHVHERLRVGEDIDITGPRNLFPLQPDAPHSVLIAGGIGITPIWSMVQALERRGQSWRLYFAARSRDQAAYLDDIEALAGQSRCGSLVTHFDDEAAGQHLDIGAILATAPTGSHLYCCGPAIMLDAFERAAAHWPKAQVHLERFGGAETAASNTEACGEFQVKLARSGQCLTVPADRSILEVLLDHGIDAPYGCMQGVCGMCAVPVLEGTPDHRDQILDEATRQAHARVIVCCSRSMTPSLSLDL